MSSTANMLSDLKAWARGAAVWSAYIATGASGAVTSRRGVGLIDVAFASGIYTLTFAGPVAEVIGVSPEVWAKSLTTPIPVNLQVGDVTFPGNGRVVVTLITVDYAGALSVNGVADAAFSVDVFAHRSGANKNT